MSTREIKLTVTETAHATLIREATDRHMTLTHFITAVLRDYCAESAARRGREEATGQRHACCWCRDRGPAGEARCCRCDAWRETIPTRPPVAWTTGRLVLPGPTAR